jgi:hypothetical protein
LTPRASGVKGTPVTARVHVAGILSDGPVSRTLKGRGQCVAATLKAKDGNNTQLWHIIAFNETAQAELRRFTDGEAVAVRGALKAELYDRNGQTEKRKKASLSLAGQATAGNRPSIKLTRRRSRRDDPKF